LLFPLLLFAQDEAGQPAPKQKSEIRFPGSVGMAPAKLTGENLWVAESAKPFFVIPGVLDVVKIFKADGPLTIAGRFVDGTGEFELRQYKGPYVVIVQAAGKGKVDLLTFLEGGKEADVVRKTVEVDSGKGPQPPPDPPTPPTPDDPLAKALFGAWQQEFATDKKDSASKMAQCYDAAAKVSDSATSWGEISSAIKTKAGELGIAGKLPILSKAVNGQLIAAGFPASPSVLLGPGDAAKAKTTLLKVSSTLRSLP
jgi:hypothetical protein